MPTKKKTAGKAGAKKATIRDAAKIIGAPKEPAFDPYNPPLEVLTGLGSLLVHVEELTEVVGGFPALQNALVEAARGRDWRAVEFDLAAIRTLLASEPLQAWRRHMGALLPLKRSER
jgi:hypothetical protein